MPKRQKNNMESIFEEKMWFFQLEITVKSLYLGRIKKRGAWNGRSVITVIRPPYCVMKKETPKFNPFVPRKELKGL